MNKYLPTRIESHRLADGGLAEITKMGKKYYFMRSYPEGLCPPDNAFDLNKSKAYQLLEETMKKDLMDNI